MLNAYDGGNFFIVLVLDETLMDLNLKLSTSVASQQEVNNPRAVGTENWIKIYQFQSRETIKERFN